MIQGGLYEESAISLRAKREAKLNKVFQIAAIVFFALAVIVAFIFLPTIPGFIMAAKEAQASPVLPIITVVLGVLMLVATGVLFWIFRRRFNVSYDYTFVEDELRITKVLNERKRKFITALKADQILKIGYCTADSYKTSLAGLGGKKPKFVTPNAEPAEDKQFVYILTTTTLGKNMYIIECRTMLLEYLVRATGRSKFTTQ
ncbi:MAG: hypothetical protein K2N84_05670 [Clostridia bacterium]|nr:hypothetical protein [Clostridia bacterium]